MENHPQKTNSQKVVYAMPVPRDLDEENEERQPDAGDSNGKAYCNYTAHGIHAPTPNSVSEIGNSRRAYVEGPVPSARVPALPVPARDLELAEPIAKTRA